MKWQMENNENQWKTTKKLEKKDNDTSFENFENLANVLVFPRISLLLGHIWQIFSYFCQKNDIWGEYIDFGGPKKHIKIAPWS